MPKQCADGDDDCTDIDSDDKVKITAHLFIPGCLGSNARIARRSPGNNDVHRVSKLFGEVGFPWWSLLGSVDKASTRKASISKSYCADSVCQFC